MGGGGTDGCKGVWMDGCEGMGWLDGGGVHGWV